MDNDSLPGALVISLDFELRWGVRDHAGSAWEDRLAGARRAIPRVLDLFGEFEVAATWATVGFLFAAVRREIEESAPSVRPGYEDPALSPYDDPIGEDEDRDPLRFGASLVERIRATARQEIGSHTFSHYYCREPGQDRGAFRADLQAAASLAARKGIRLRSIVFPRNQHNPVYDDLLLESGITAYRGNPASWAWRFGDAAESRSARRRAMRLLDAYVDVSGAGTHGWDSLSEPSGLTNVRASFPLRPYQPRLAALDPLRLRRLHGALRDAARRGRLLHLWWHPHNFGAWTDRNLAFLRAVLEEFARLREEEGMLSLTMAETDDIARRTFERHGAEASSR